MTSTTAQQKIWVLDYITAAKRTGSDEVFHTELGFWGWDPDRKRGDALLHGPAHVDDSRGWHLPSPTPTTFSLHGVEARLRGLGRALQPLPLTENAKCTRYESTYTIDGDTFSYDENTVMDMKALGGKSMDHTDKNTLKRV